MSSSTQKGLTFGTPMAGFRGHSTLYFPFNSAAGGTQLPTLTGSDCSTHGESNLPADLQRKFKLCHSVNTIYLD